MASCKECLSELPCSKDLQEMYHNKAEKCPFFKNKADYAEVKHGKWVAYPHNSGIYCSECRHKRRYKDMNDKFCPNCGAIMDEGSNQSG